MAIYGTGTFEATMRGEIRSLRDRIHKVEASLDSLKQRDSAYGEEHAELLHVFNRMIRVCQEGITYWRSLRTAKNPTE